MNFRKTQFVLLSTFIVLIVLVLGFTGGLNISSFQKNHTDSLVSSYSVAGDEGVRKIEYAVKYGKPLTNFYGIEDILSEITANLPEIEDVHVVLPDGKILYSQDGPIKDAHIIPELLQTHSFDGDDAELPYKSSLHEGKYHIFLPIKDRDAAWIGSLSFVFDESLITATTDTHIRTLLYQLTVLALIALFLFFVYILRFKPISEDGKIRKKSVLTAVIIILGITQIVYGILNYQLFKKAYIEIAQDNIEKTTHVVQKDIESVIAKGVPYEKLNDLNQYLDKIRSSVPLIERIELTNSQGEILHFSGERLQGAVAEYRQRSLLMSDANDLQPEIHVTLSNSYLNGHLSAIILDMLTILVTSFIFLVEITLFILIVLRKQQGSGDKEHSVGYDDSDVRMVRPLAFVMMMAIFLSVSFIPLVMKQLYEPLWGLPENVILGLPISAEMLMAGLATIAAGYLIDIKGWRFVFYTGLVCFSLATLVSALASNGAIFILSRALAGAGYGFALMALRGLVNGTDNESQRTLGVSALFSGMYAGINCGVIVGAMLADRIGFSMVFLVALGILAISFLFTFLVFREKRETGYQHHKRRQSQLQPGALKAFFVNRKVVTLFMFIIMPTAVCSMFLDYYFPIFAESIGVSASNIGRAFLLNGLCVVYLGPVLSTLFNRVLGVKYSIVASGLLVVGGLALFGWQGTLWAAFAAVILLGIADSFGLVAHNNYFLKLESVRAIGTGKALGYYGNIRKLGQMLGPMIFGLVAFMGVAGVGIIGAAFLLAILIFFVSQRERSASPPQAPSSSVNM